MSTTPYTPVQSAVVFLNTPLHKATMNFLNGVLENNSNKTKNNYLLAFVYMPITTVATPVAIVADIVIGISEAVFIAIKGHSKQEVKSLLYRKVIVNPLRDAMHTVLKVVCLIPPLCFISFILTSTLTTDKNRFDEMNELLQKIRNPNSPIKEFEKRIQEARDLIHNKTTPSPAGSTEYEAFKTLVLTKDTYRELLGFTENQSFTDTELKKKYRKLTLYLHPDKNTARKDEAKALFLCLDAAQKSLELQADKTAATGT